MNTKPIQTEIPVINYQANQDAIEIARRLGEMLFKTPEYQNFSAALESVNHDERVVKLSMQLREHEEAVQWQKGDLDQHQSAIHQIQNEIEDLDVVRNYRLSEATIVNLCYQIDQIIKQSSGVDFAVNARQSGCGCGG